MNRFVLLSFVFLGWAFYELSGGADYAPRPDFANAQTDHDTQPSADEFAVTRLALADTNQMNSEQSAAIVSHSDRALEEAVLAALLAPEAETAVLADVRRETTGSDIPGTISEPKLQHVKVTLPISRPVAEPAVVTEVATAEIEPEPALDLRAVARDRVNLRDGPGTEFSVLGKLNRGATVQVLEDSGEGWVMLQVVPGGKIGWMADWLLTQEG